MFVVLYANGAPERIRTSDPQIRSLVLYPAELRARAATWGQKTAGVGCVSESDVCESAPSLTGWRRLGKRLRVDISLS